MRCTGRQPTTAWHDQRGTAINVLSCSRRGGPWGGQRQQFGWRLVCTVRRCFVPDEVPEPEHAAGVWWLGTRYKGCRYWRAYAIVRAVRVAVPWSLSGCEAVKELRVSCWQTLGGAVAARPTGILSRARLELRWARRCQERLLGAAAAFGVAGGRWRRIGMSMAVSV